LINVDVNAEEMMIKGYILTLLSLFAANINLSCRAFSPVSRPLPTTLFRKPLAESANLGLCVSTDQIDGNNSNPATTSEYSSSLTRSAALTPSQRRIANVEKYARLPVWPVWQGVFLFFASKIFGPEVAAQWEDNIGGRVCPNFFEPAVTAPFVLLVHHRHGENVDACTMSLFAQTFPSFISRDILFPTSKTLPIKYAK